MTKDLLSLLAATKFNLVPKNYTPMTVIILCFNTKASVIKI